MKRFSSVIRAAVRVSTRMPRSVSTVRHLAPCSSSSLLSVSSLPTSSPTLSPFSIGQSVRYFAKKKGKKGKKESSVSDTSSLGEEEGEAIDMKKLDEKLSKYIERFTTDLSSIRAGRASPEQLDHIKVSAYDDMLPLRQLALVSVSGAQKLSILAHDDSTTASIVTAINDCGMNLSAASDGQKTVTVIFPKVSSEMRQDLAKQAGKKAEETKGNLRKVRKQNLDALKKEKSNIGEDEFYRSQDAVQKAVDSYTKKVDEELKKKEEEILSAK